MVKKKKQESRRCQYKEKKREKVVHSAFIEAQEGRLFFELGQHAADARREHFTIYAI